MNDRHIFGTTEAAAYLGLTPQTVRWHVNKKRDLSPDKRIGGRFMVFARETLDAFLESREPDPNLPLLYSTEQAAEYLGLTVDAMRYHLNRVEEKTLHPDHIISGCLLFTQETLDAFKSR